MCECCVPEKKEEEIKTKERIKEKNKPESQ